MGAALVWEKGRPLLQYQKTEQYGVLGIEVIVK
jgi:hypothetical protein